MLKSFSQTGCSIGFCLFVLGSTILQGSARLCRTSCPQHALTTEASENLILAQTQLTAEQMPTTSQITNPSQLQYGQRVRGNLSVSNFRHQGRRFAFYEFEGQQDQLIRISLVGGNASDRPNDRLQTGSLLVNPVLVLLDPDGNIIAQQPEQSNVANALIRMTLPATGNYRILVTSATIGTGGRYTLTLQQLRQDGSNKPVQ